MISLPYLVITLIYITGVSLLVTSVGRECIVYTCYYDNNQLFKNISLVWCCNNSNTLPPVYSFDCRLLTVRLWAALCLCRVLGAYWVLSSQSTVHLATGALWSAATPVCSLHQNCHSCPQTSSLYLLQTWQRDLHHCILILYTSAQSLLSPQIPYPFPLLFLGKLILQLNSE